MGPLMTEAQWQGRVVDWAKLRGWRIAHVRDARKQMLTGLPDLLMVRAGRMVCLELKAHGGRVGKSQVEWLDDLDEVPGVTARLAYPQDWDDVRELLW